MKSQILNSGTTFLYEENDINSDKMLLFIHGALQTSFAFSHLLEQYSNIKCVSINLTGFGKSHNTHKKNNLLKLVVDDLHEFIQWYFKTHNISDCILVSYSFGTYITLKMFEEYKQPKQVSKVILTAPYGLTSYVNIYTIIGYKLYQYCLSCLNYIIDYNDYITKPHNFSHELISSTVNLSIRGFYVTNPLLSVLNKISIPIYVIYGEYDYVSPTTESNILKIFSDVIKKSITIKNANHYLIYEDNFKTVLNNLLHE